MNNFHSTLWSSLKKFEENDIIILEFDNDNKIVFIENDGPNKWASTWLKLKNYQNDLGKILIKLSFISWKLMFCLFSMSYIYGLSKIHMQKVSMRISHIPKRLLSSFFRNSGRVSDYN